jgi:KipI family sensor histidine kinase inhibitor
MTAAPRYLPAGESALVVEYGATADPAFHDRVLALDAALAAHPIAGIRETVPTYRSLMVHFDPRQIATEALIDALASVVRADIPARRGRLWRIPACYDPPHAEDIDELAAALDLTPERIAALHCGARYKVVMYGFAPGFVFLSGLPDALKVSRRQTPRPPAQPGALTIANGQALIASIAMPTGWYVVGRTPARTFDPGRDPAFPIAVGDEVAFERIDAATFDVLAETFVLRSDA